MICVAKSLAIFAFFFLIWPDLIWIDLIWFRWSTLDSNPNEYLECRKKNEKIICGAKILAIFAFLDLNWSNMTWLDLNWFEWSTLDSIPNRYLECRREEKNERMICGAKSLGIFSCHSKSLCHANSRF